MSTLVQSSRHRPTRVLALVAVVLGALVALTLALGAPAAHADACSDAVNLNPLIKADRAQVQTDLDALNTAQKTGDPTTIQNAQDALSGDQAKLNTDIRNVTGRVSACQSSGSVGVTAPTTTTPSTSTSSTTTEKTTVVQKPTVQVFPLPGGVTTTKTTTVPDTITLGSSGSSGSGSQVSTVPNVSNGVSTGEG